MAALNIHHEGLNPNSFPNKDQTYYFRQILEKNIPVVISPCLNNYKRGDWDSKGGVEALELAREIVKREGSVLGQQGYTHKCKYEHKFVDPWHEFYCLWRKRISRVEQKEWMKRGREELEKLMGKTPELFVPPNHYFDETTLAVAEELGYNYFTNQAVIHLKPYKFGDMIVVPEGNLVRDEIEGRAVVYVHTDQIYSNEDTYRNVLDDINSIKDIKPQFVARDERELNEKLKYRRKRMRDFVKMPRRILKRLIKYRERTK